MPSTLPAEKVTLYDLEQRFHLQRCEDPQFFSEWQQDLLPLTETEQLRLDRVKAIGCIPVMQLSINT